MSTTLVRHAPSGGIELIEGHYKGGTFIPFYVPRELMPQLDEKDYPRLVYDAMKRGGPQLTFETVDLHCVNPHQRISRSRADAMGERVRIKPIIVSTDNYVVDGNHRWWANHHANRNYINVIRLQLDFDAALAWLFKRPYVYRLTPTTEERN